MTETKGRRLQLAPCPARSARRVAGVAVTGCVSYVQTGTSARLAAEHLLVDALHLGGVIAPVVVLGDVGPAGGAQPLAERRVLDRGEQMASASAAASFGGTRRPVTPSRTTSGMP